MSILTTTQALVTALRTEGTLSALPAPGPAPWGSRVHLRRTSDVVEVSGARAGEPVSPTWPVLFLYGPRVEEMAEHRHPKGTFEQNYNPTAHTVEKRGLPRMYRLIFRAVWQTRSGFGTGSGEGATTAEAQSLDGIARFERWVSKHRAFEGGLLFSKALSTEGGRPTPADIIEAVGEIRIEYVPEYDDEAVVVPTDATLDVTTTPSRSLP